MTDRSTNEHARSPLAEFRKSWNAGDVVVEESGLTADDRDVFPGETAEGPPSFDPQMGVAIEQG